MILEDKDAPAPHFARHRRSSTPSLQPDSQFKRLEVVSDFDGTIVTIDVVEYLLGRFANGDWRKYDDQFERGEISLEDCLRQQYGMITEPRQILLNAVDSAASFRAGFDELVAFCRKKGASFTIVSAGLDFVISYLLRRENLEDQLAVLAPKSRLTSHGILLDFTALPHVGSSNFKSSFVKSSKAKGTRVVYIGDGLSDFEAIKEADIRFVIKGSRLAEQCKKDNVECREIVSLAEVTRSPGGQSFSWCHTATD